MKNLIAAKTRKLLLSIRKISGAVGSFKSSKLLILCLTFCSFIMIFVILHGIYHGTVSFNQEQLRELSTFSINVSFTIAALGFTIFSLPVSPTFHNKKDIILRFIGSLLSNISISIFAYIFSFSNLDDLTISLKAGSSHCFSLAEILFCASLLSLCINIVYFLKIIVKCFHAEPK